MQRQRRYIAMGEREDDDSPGNGETDIGQIEVHLQDELDDGDVDTDMRMVRDMRQNSSPELGAGLGEDEEDEIEAMERLMRNKMNLAKQLVY